MRRVGGLLVVVMLTFGLAGCSLPYSPDVASVAHGAAPGTVLVRVSSNEDPYDQYVVLDVDAHIVTVGTPTQQPVLTEDCVGNDRYRVPRRSLEVDETDGDTGVYRGVWSVTGVQYQRLAWSYYNSGDPALTVSSTSVVVLGAPGGHVVFVANGRDGLLYRDVGGAWHRLGTPRVITVGTGTTSTFHPPTTLPIPPPSNPRLEVAAAVSVLLLFVVALVCAERRQRPRPAQVAVIVVLVGYQAWASAAVTTHFALGRDLAPIEGVPVYAMLFAVDLLAVLAVLGRPPHRRSG
jgi:hypothetical protein